MHAGGHQGLLLTLTLRASTQCSSMGHSKTSSCIYRILDVDIWGGEVSDQSIDASFSLPNPPQHGI